MPNIASGTYKVDADTKQAVAANRGLTASIGKINVAAALAGGALVGLGANALRGAINAERGLREVNTLLSLGSAGFKQLQTDTLEFAREVGRTSSDVIPALYQSISAGVPRDSVFEFLEVSSDLARAGVTNLKSSTDLLTTAVNAYASENLTAERAADVFFAAVRGGKTTVDEIAQSAFNLLPTAAAMRVRFEEATAAMTALTLQGTPTSVAMTQVRQLIASLGAPTKRAAQTAKELGFEMSAQRLQTQGLLPVLNDLIMATGGNEAKVRELLGSQEALQAAFVLTSGEGRTYERLLRDLEESGGATTAAAREMEEALGVQLEQTLAELQTTLEIIAIQILPPLNAALRWSVDNKQVIVAAIAAIGAAWLLAGNRAAVAGGQFAAAGAAAAGGGAAAAAGGGGFFAGLARGLSGGARALGAIGLGATAIWHGGRALLGEDYIWGDRPGGLIGDRFFSNPSRRTDPLYRENTAVELAAQDRARTQYINVNNGPVVTLDTLAQDVLHRAVLYGTNTPGIVPAGSVLLVP